MSWLPLLERVFDRPVEDIWDELDLPEGPPWGLDAAVARARGGLPEPQGAAVSSVPLVVGPSPDLLAKAVVRDLYADLGSLSPSALRGVSEGDFETGRVVGLDLGGLGTEGWLTEEAEGAAYSRPPNTRVYYLFGWGWVAPGPGGGLPPRATWQVSRVATAGLYRWFEVASAPAAALSEAPHQHLISHGPARLVQAVLALASDLEHGANGYARRDLAAIRGVLALHLVPLLAPTRCLPCPPRELDGGAPKWETSLASHSLPDRQLGALHGPGGALRELVDDLEDVRPDRRVAWVASLLDEVQRAVRELSAVEPRRAAVIQEALGAVRAASVDDVRATVVAADRALSELGSLLGKKLPQATAQNLKRAFPDPGPVRLQIADEVFRRWSEDDDVLSLLAGEHSSRV